MGVCFPSFGISAGATLFDMKSQACERMVAKPLLLIYSKSLSLSLNLLLNFDFDNFENKSSNIPTL